MDSQAVFNKGDSVTMRVLALTRYGRLGSASRLRVLQYLPALGEAQVSVDVQPLFDDEALAHRYEHGRHGLSTVLRSFGRRLRALLQRQRYDLIWIEKEALPWWPLWIEQALLAKTPYVLDYDDAVFHQYDQHRIAWVRRLYGERIDRLMRQAALVVCGNDYLAQRARLAGAAWVELLPTVIDLERYPVHVRSQSAVPRVVWIGSPYTAKYLYQLRQPLKQLAHQQPFVLRVIGADFQLDGVQIENLPWTEASEVQAIAECDVGVMPLLNSPWEQGKCGYKLIQYMACGLPVVASPVGVNVDIVSNSVDGFLANDNAEWLGYLSMLLTDSALRQRMGVAGRQKVVSTYCLQVTAPRLVEWFKQINSGGRRVA